MPSRGVISTAFANPLSVTVKNPIEPVAGGVISFATPSSGASAALSSDTATIGSNGVASVTAKANSTAGSYTVTASIPGTAAVADFKLTNARASSKEVLVLTKKMRSLELEAEIEPLFPGAGVPTGEVIFELVRKNKDPKVLGTASLSGGTATLPVKLTQRYEEVDHDPLRGRCGLRVEHIDGDHHTALAHVDRPAHGTRFKAALLIRP